MANRFFMSFILLISLTPYTLFAKDTMKTQEAIFAMGCFWCGESEFRDHKSNEMIPGVKDIKVGYAGGTEPNPTYENHKGYKEALKVVFDPKVISYKELLDIFWHNVDMFDGDGQFCDRGFAYTSAVYYVDDSQKQLAEKDKARLEKQFEQPILTQIIPFTTFYDAEDYHQDYKAKNPKRYTYYRWSCGRDARLKSIWKDSES